MAMPSLDFLLSLYNRPNDTINTQYIHWSIDTFNPTNIKKDFFKLNDLAVITLNNFMHDWGHKFIYSAQMMENTLNLIGFGNIKKCSVGESSYEALCNLEQHGTQIPNWANQLETVVFEAEKV